jgi:DHA1 family inner membrane transport protein
VADRTRWPVVILGFAAGIAAAMQVGKVPPALPLIRVDLGLGLIGAGWVVSLLNAIGAAAGALTGLVADRFGRRRIVLLGLALLASGSALGGLAPNGAALLAARFLEGVGMISVVVSVGALLTEVAAPADQGLIVGSWAIYLPVGMGSMLLLAPLVLGFGWRVLWLGNAALLLALMVALAAVTRGVGAAPAIRRRLADLEPVVARPGPWLLGLIFACYTLQWMAVMAWLPSYAAESLGLGAGVAALATAGVVLINAPGCFMGGVLVHRGVPRWLLVVIALVTMAASAIGFFSDTLPPLIRYLLVAAFSAVGGLLPAALLAAAPAHAPSPRDVAAVNGMINQGANLGTFGGPPLAAAIVSLAGSWAAAAPLLPIMAALGIGLALALRAVERGRARNP